MVLIVACMVFGSTKAGLLPGPAYSTHGLALGPLLAHSAVPALPALPALAAPAYVKPALAAPALVKAVPSVDYVAYPKYEFKYGVADGHTGDQKSQSEIRDGDVVKGSYSLVEADGTLRTVTYSADDHNGFNAVVTRSGHAVHPATPIALAPKVIAAPVPAYSAIAASPYGHGLGLGLLKG